MENNNEQQESMQNENQGVNATQVPQSSQNVQTVKNDQQQANNQLVFGKYKSLDEAQKGYQNAQTKIKDQGTELNKIKETLNQNKPIEDYSPEEWVKRFDTWKTDKSLPEELNYDISDPLFDTMLKGFEKAGVSEKQAVNFISAAIERQKSLAQEKTEAIFKELGPEGEIKIKELEDFSTKNLSPEDLVSFQSLFVPPYVDASHVDLLHRLLIGKKEQQIPLNGTSVNVAKSSNELYNDIKKFQPVWGCMMNL